MKPLAFVFSVLKMGIVIQLRYVPKLFIAEVPLCILMGIFAALTIVTTQWLIDAVVGIVMAGGELYSAFFMLIALGFTLLMHEVLHGLYNFIFQLKLTKLNGVNREIIHRKIAKIDAICFEDVKLYDDIMKARQGAGHMNGMVALVTTVIFYYVPYFIFMGIYLHHLQARLVIALFFIFIPTAIAQFLRTGIMARFIDEQTPIDREYTYYQQTIVDREYFKETRRLGAFPFFMRRLINVMAQKEAVEWRACVRTNRLEFIIVLLRGVGYLGILFLLVSALLMGDISVGAFAAVFGSINILFGLMQEMVDGYIGRLTSGVGMAHNFIRFLHLPEREGEIVVPKEKEGIVAQNISFTYPGAHNPSLTNISLTIKAGEKIAIVGENGAGKTSLVRLLTGLYLPNKGIVWHHGMNTSKVHPACLFAKQSGVFQHFMRYQMSVGENVKISDTAKNEPIEPALTQSGICIETSTFPLGIDTMLSREFKGVELSGGQWQRIALARGIYRANSCIVLDEPTAAIDPIEESFLYNKFIEMAEGRTTIIVTHRLGLAKIAERVVVMASGCIMDIGTHDELMIRCDLYKKMFQSQAEWYKPSDEKTF